ncbi:MAG: acyltransferase [Rhizobiales bacterium]|nr:acyltransferase [Hyphomicrobiales bacterium]
MDKDHSLDSLRGLACVLLVAYHVIGAQPDQGLRVADGSYLRYMNESLLYIRMPLFTFLSGYVYALRPLQGDGVDFALKKLRRLLIPMMVVATLYIIMQMLVPGTNRSYSFMLLYTGHPVAHFWFLESLLLIFLVLIALEQSGVLLTRAAFLLIFAGASLISLLNVQPTLRFSINGAIYLAPYFLAGVAVHRFGFEHAGKAARAALALLALACIGATQLGLSSLAEIDLGRQSPVGFAAGMTSVLALFLFRFRNQVLATIGAYAYTIYLFHVFGTAGTRIVLERLGLSNQEMHLALGIAAGIAAPIVLERLLERYDLPRLLLFGKSMRRRHAVPIASAGSGWAKMRARSLPILAVRPRKTPLSPAGARAALPDRSGGST